MSTPLSTPPPQEPQETTPDVKIMTALAVLPAQALVSEHALARLFQRDVTSVKRAVARGELPPPVPLFGRNVWTAQALLEHISARLAAAAQEAARTTHRLNALRPVPGPRDREG
jgi:hypothetical protein